MPNIKRTWDLVPQGKKDIFIRQITDWFGTEKEIELGVIAAEEIMDFFMETIGREIYNKAVDDSKAVIGQGFENMEIDLALLHKK